MRSTYSPQIDQHEYHHFTKGWNLIIQICTKSSPFYFEYRGSLMLILIYYRAK